MRTIRAVNDWVPHGLCGRVRDTVATRPAPSAPNATCPEQNAQGLAGIRGTRAGGRFFLALRAHEGVVQASTPGPFDQNAAWA
ncbi:MAG: hypothetical protein ACYCTF_09240 [Acidiferrobacter sp.]